MSVVEYIVVALLVASSIAFRIAAPSSGSIPKAERSASTPENPGGNCAIGMEAPSLTASEKPAPWARLRAPAMYTMESGDVPKPQRLNDQMIPALRKHVR